MAQSTQQRQTEAQSWVFQTPDFSFKPHGNLGACVPLGLGLGTGFVLTSTGSYAPILPTHCKYMLILDLSEVQKVLSRSSLNCLLDLADIKTEQTHFFFFTKIQWAPIMQQALSWVLAVDKAMNERDKVPFLTRLTFQWERSNPQPLSSIQGQKGKGRKTGLFIHSVFMEFLWHAPLCAICVHYLIYFPSHSCVSAYITSFILHLIPMLSHFTDSKTETTQQRPPVSGIIGI